MFSFLGGLFLGRFTGFISNVIIGGIVIFYTEPNFYSFQNFEYAKYIIGNYTKNIFLKFL